jgi:PiT family inorganic phosphate transporter
VLVVITALGFDFTNGFHDTGNAVATSIATKALEPRVAVALSGLLNLVGAFLSLAVAATIASGLVSTELVTLTVVAAGLAGGSPPRPEKQGSTPWVGSTTKHCGRSSATG